MKLIYDLINDIKEELEGAKHYYRTAIYCKEKHSDVSRKLIEIAKAELNHANSIHQLIVDLISQYKAKGKEPSEYMMKIYECSHNEYIEEYDELNYKINKLSIWLNLKGILQIKDIIK